MTIDESIEKHRKMAETQKILYDACVLKECNKHFLRRAEELEQIAEWLELLNWYEQGMEDIPSESGVLPKDVYHAGYNKAVDDFAEKAIKIVYEANNRDRNPQPRDMVADIHYKFIELAEQLKAGGNNDV